MDIPCDQRELVSRAQSGDASAIGDLVERHRALGQRIARRMVSDADVAADIVQDAAVEVVRSIRNLRAPDRFSSWYWGIVLNLCRSHLRSRARVDEASLDISQDGLHFEAIDFASTEPDPADALIEKEVREKMLDAIRELPEELQAPTLLYYFEQLTLREIAAGIGISVGNVKVRLHRARLRLRERLLADGPGSAAAGQNGEEGRHAMVQVKVFDVLHRVQRSETGAEQRAPSVVVLMDEPRERALPIWTGRAGAEAIALAVKDKATPRPLTASFMATLLRAARVEVKEVRIARLEGTTYFAEVEIISGRRTNVIDARPSDAIALAIHSHAPIYVSDEIMQRASIEIPGAADGVERQPQGIEDVIAEVERSFPPAGGRLLGREEADRASQDLVREVFGTQV